MRAIAHAYQVRRGLLPTNGRAHLPCGWRMWDTSSHLEVDVRERARGASTRQGRGVQNHVRGRGEVGATSEAALEIVPRRFIKDPSLVWNTIFSSGAVEGMGWDGLTIALGRC